MWFLYILEQLRNPVLDAFFSFITLFGDETLFMAIGMIVFWCVDKWQGYYLFCVGFFGTVLNQFLKVLFRVPRPWVKDPEFTVVESAVEEATGYSFPSGHTQSSVGLFGGLARWNTGRVIRWVSIAMCVLVPFSRMYLGVHTPADVLTSVAIALVLVFAAYPLFKKMEASPRWMYGVLGGLTLCVVAFLAFLQLAPLEAGEENVASAVENANTLLGCMLGLLVIYPLDQKFIRFSTKGVWWAQILKVAGGILLVLAVKTFTKAPLEALFDGGMIARTIRYFLIVLAGGALWPMTFRWFEKLGCPKEKQEREI